MTERIMPVDRMEQIISVFGSFDRNIRIVEAELAVKVIDREAELHISGEAENVMLAEKAIGGLLSLAARGENIDEQNVRYII
ncbi:MAG: phosphate starvation-inducible protein PhoH, partial [Bacillota bacterium]